MREASGAPGASSKRKTSSASQEDLRERVANLSRRDIEQASSAWKCDADAPVVTLPCGAGGSDVVLRGCSFQRLADPQWLDDELVNAYMYLLSEREARMCARDSHRKPNLFFTSAFFWRVLQSEEQGGRVSEPDLKRVIKRWVKKYEEGGGGGGEDGDGDDDIVAVWCDADTEPVRCRLPEAGKVFIPINMGGGGGQHWALAVIDFAGKKLEYYDSCNYGGTFYIGVLRRFVREYAIHRGLNDLATEVDTWAVRDHGDTSPQQENGSDCGVYTCLTADYLAQGLPLSFGGRSSRARVRVGKALRVLMTLGLLNRRLTW